MDARVWISRADVTLSESIAWVGRVAVAATQEKFDRQQIRLTKASRDIEQARREGVMEAGKCAEAFASSSVVTMGSLSAVPR
jgi:hypothetical protein